MISSVRGTVLAAVGTTVVIEVGGVGLNVQVTPQHALSLRVGSEATVRTALIVREDDLSLYGFSEADELTVFDGEVDGGDHIDFAEGFADGFKGYLAHGNLYLTAPKVRPRTSCFWLNQPRIRIGAMAMVLAALSFA